MAGCADAASLSQKFGADPLIVDVRTAGARSADPRRIPGAMVMTVDDVDARLAELPRGREIILYCTWPNEASACGPACSSIGGSS
jgi:rhodanese-related sulfurtransferase